VASPQQAAIIRGSHGPSRPRQGRPLRARPRMVQLPGSC
jgi:hypothetical protein